MTPEVTDAEKAARQQMGNTIWTVIGAIVIIWVVIAKIASWSTPPDAPGGATAQSEQSRPTNDQDTQSAPGKPQADMTGITPERQSAVSVEQPQPTDREIEKLTNDLMAIVREGRPAPSTSNDDVPEWVKRQIGVDNTIRENDQKVNGFGQQRP